jgi:hypothetical protein
MFRKPTEAERRELEECIRQDWRDTELVSECYSEIWHLIEEMAAKGDEVQRARLFHALHQMVDAIKEDFERLDEQRNETRD